MGWRVGTRVLIVLLQQGGVVAQGTAAEVQVRATIERVYGWPVTVQPHPGPGTDTGIPQVIPLGNLDRD